MRPERISHTSLVKIETRLKKEKFPQFRRIIVLAIIENKEEDKKDLIIEGKLVEMSSPDRERQNIYRIITWRNKKSLMQKNEPIVSLPLQHILRGSLTSRQPN